MRTQSRDGLPATAFFSRTYDEALALLQEARDYLRFEAEADWRGLAPGPGLAFTGETTRLTARLTNLMAWLLLQRAVHAGEIGREEAAREAPALGRIAVCLEGERVETAALSERLRQLLERSLNLYRRVSRLDEMLRRDLAPPAVRPA